MVIPRAEINTLRTGTPSFNAMIGGANIIYNDVHSTGTDTIFRINDGSTGREVLRIGNDNRVTISTSTSIGKEMMVMNQNDNHPFIDYRGVSSTDGVSPISSNPTAAITGYIKSKINNSVVWIPYSSNTPT